MTIIVSTNISCGLLIGFYGDQFPTHLRYVDILVDDLVLQIFNVCAFFGRAMAVNMIVMFGRLGSVLGINFVAATIFRHCTELCVTNFYIMLGAVIVTYYILWKIKGA